MVVRQKGPSRCAQWKLALNWESLSGGLSSKRCLLYYLLSVLWVIVQEQQVVRLQVKVLADADLLIHAARILRRKLEDWKRSTLRHCQVLLILLLLLMSLLVVALLCLRDNRILIGQSSLNDLLDSERLLVRYDMYLRLELLIELLFGVSLL